MKTRGVLVGIFALWIIANAVSCGNDSGTTNIDTANISYSESEDTTTLISADNDPQIEAVDWEGDTLTLLTEESTGDYRFPYNEFVSEGENGEPINDAIWNRNAIIAEKYNLTYDVVLSQQLTADARKTLMAGDAVYDLLFPRTDQASILSQEKLLQELSDLPHVDIEQSWWRTSIMKQTSIDGKYYFLTGDLNLAALNTVGVVFFNQQLAEELDCGNLYEIVESGNWTFDTMQTFCRGVTRDINGDSKYTQDDMFGLTTNGFVWQPFFGGMGTRLIEKDAEDIPVLCWDSDENIAALSRVLEFVNDENAVMIANRFKDISDIGQASVDIFSDNRALFWIELIYGSMTLREMNTDFGILPMPKKDVSQDDYHSYMHAGNSTTTAIPITYGDFDRIGRIIEDMAYQSSRTVRPAYYEVTLKGKVARDDSTAHMLDIIYSDINLDLAILYGAVLPIDSQMRNFLITGETDYLSKITSLKKSCQRKIDEIVETFTDAE